MRANCPIHWHAPSDLPGFWSVARYEDVQTVYTNPQIYSSAQGVLLRPLAQGADPGGGLTLALTDSPRHRTLRSLMASRFTERAVRARADSIRARARSLLEEAYAKQQCDFSVDVAARLTFFVTCDVLGVPESEQQMLFAWVHEAFSAGTSLAAHRDCLLFIATLIESRKEAPVDDLLTHLVHFAKPDGTPELSTLEVLLNCENLLGATENAGLSIAGAIAAFLDYPDQWDLLRANQAMMPTAIQEIFRWTSSATHSVRTATAQTKLGDADIQPGDRVATWLPSANRDEQAFINPYQFDIQRQPNRHLALGLGEHVCIGGPLARVEMEAVLMELIGSGVHIQRDGIMVAARSIAVNGPAVLPIRFR
jgi:cytochrome P450